MKRSILYLAAGALALSACTSESVLEDAVRSRNMIGFENVVNKHTRADLTTSNLSMFNVFGYYTTPVGEGETDPKVAVSVFEDTPVYLQEDGSWKYNVSDRYWVPGARYYFYAYSCGNQNKITNENGEEVVDGGQLKSSFGTFAQDMTNGKEPSDRVLYINDYICDATHQHDLVYASNTGAVAADEENGIEANEFAGILGKEAGNDKVAFQFHHLLTKVQAQFTSNFPDDYEVIISDVTIQNIRNKGDYNPNSQNGWQNIEREGNAYVSLLNTAASNVNPITTSKGIEAAKTNSAYVIPHQYKDTQVYLMFTINVKNKGQIVLTKELKGSFNPIWVKGYTYTYNIEISGSAAHLQAIAFTTAKDAEGKDIAVDNWGSDGQVNPTITID